MAEERCTGRNVLCRCCGMSTPSAACNAIHENGDCPKCQAPVAQERCCYACGDDTHVLSRAGRYVCRDLTACSARLNARLGAPVAQWKEHYMMDCSRDLCGEGSVNPDSDIARYTHKPPAPPVAQDGERLAVALENMRRIGARACVHCGQDYDAHDPAPACYGLKCDHCHQSDFQIAEPDDPTLLSADEFALVVAEVARLTAENERLAQERDEAKRTAEFRLISINAMLETLNDLATVLGADKSRRSGDELIEKATAAVSETTALRARVAELEGRSE